MMHATEMLRDVPVFRGVADETIAHLESSTRMRRLEDGEVYIQAGQSPRAFCVIISGQLKFYRVNRSGKEQIFGYGRPADIFGLTSLTDPYKPAAVNCMARMTTELLEIELPVMRELMQRDATLTLAILREQSRRYSTMLNMVDQLSLMDAHNRLAKWLDTWITDNHADAGDHEIMIVLPYTQSEIAAQIGTVREVVSRGFSRMEKEGILRSSGKRLTLMSRKKLRQMADQ